MEIVEISKGLIKADPQNPRKNFDAEEISNLQSSIEKNGQLEPIHIEKITSRSYLINEGHKRYAAIKKSTKIKTVFAIVENKLSDEERLFKQITMDTHRKDWDINDRDKAWERLWKMGDYDEKSFAKKLSVSKGMVESFLDRMDLGAEFVKKIDKVSPYNIAETTRVKDKELRKKVLEHANKNQLGRKEIRKLSGVAEKVSKEVINELFKNKISIDDVENMVGLDKTRQSQALETTKGMNQHKKKLKKMLSDGSIKTEEVSEIKRLSQEIGKFQKEFFKTGYDLRNYANGLNKLSKDSGVLNEQLIKILTSCVNELEEGINAVTPSIKQIRKVLK